MDVDLGSVSFKRLMDSITAQVEGFSGDSNRLFHTKFLFAHTFSEYIMNDTSLKYGINWMVVSGKREIAFYVERIV